ATASQLQSTLSSAVKQLKVFQVDNGQFPTANVCPSPGATEICFKAPSEITIVYAPNNSANPPSFSLSASKNGTSYVATDSSQPSQSYGSNFVTITNLAVNGDFGSGGTGWTTNCPAPSTCIFAGGTLTMTTDGTQRANATRTMPGTYTDNDKIFYSMRVRRDSGTGFRFSAHRDNGGYETVLFAETAFNSMGTGAFERKSGIRNFVASQGTFTMLALGQNVNAKIFQVTIDDVLAINLTSAFGAGNEPSVPQMDGILTQFPNGYFNGSVQATY
ncbi:MAG: hypothetical protein QG649_801, partial [Patescibacteria group bacterium]|nr:hypothetical protein [Patescibacteria group bacterium]